MKKKRKELILGGLLLVLAASVTWRVGNPYVQESVGELKYKPASPRVVKKITPGETGEREGVYLSLFLNPPDHGGAVLNDPFYKKKRVLKKKEKPRPARRSAPADRPPRKVDPLIGVREELQRFKVFGTYEGQGKKGVFLSRGKQLLIVRPGDRIDGKYLVEEITGSSIKLLVTALGETVYIDMSRF